MKPADMKLNNLDFEEFTRTTLLLEDIFEVIINLSSSPRFVHTALALTKLNLSTLFSRWFIHQAPSV